MTKRILYLFSLVVISIGSADAQKINLSKGQKLEMLSTGKMIMTIEIGGQNIENSSESNTTSMVEVKEINNDGFLFDNTLKRMIVKATGMGQEVNFDSDKKEDMDGQMGQALKDKIGKTEEVLVSKQGKIIETKGDSTAAGIGGLTELMSLATDLSKGQAFPLLLQLPGKPIKPGDSWVDSTGTAQGIKTVTTYTLKEIKGDDLMVSFTGTVTKNGIIQQSGMEIQVDLNGTMKGDVTYETASGILKKNTTSSDIKGTLGVAGQNAPITMTLTANTVAKKL